MADDEDDYLSDKFLLEASKPPSTAPKTYSHLRKEASRQAFLKSQQNKQKSQRQLREEGLSKSLFERVKEEEDSGVVASGNKALSIMMKMGFKPGQALGKDANTSAPTADSSKPEIPDREGSIGIGHTDPSSSSTLPSTSTSIEPQNPTITTNSHHKIEPIPINEWAGMSYPLPIVAHLPLDNLTLYSASTGKKGIGLGKRPRSPTTTSAERVAKMAKMEEESSNAHLSFRDRARQEYEERRAEGRLAPAQRTCVTLDEKSGISVRFPCMWSTSLFAIFLFFSFLPPSLHLFFFVSCRRNNRANAIFGCVGYSLQFNILWLNPQRPDSFPEGLTEALALRTNLVIHPERDRERQRNSVESRLRAQMRADALHSVEGDDDDIDTIIPPGPTQEFFTETLQEAVQFLRLNVGASSPFHPLAFYLFLATSPLSKIGQRPTAIGPCISARQVLVLFLVRDSI